MLTLKNKQTVVPRTNKQTNKQTDNPRLYIVELIQTTEHNIYRSRQLIAGNTHPSGHNLNQFATNKNSLINSCVISKKRGKPLLYVVFQIRKSSLRSLLIGCV